MLIADEGEHTQNVFLFQSGCRVDGCEEVLDLGRNVGIPESPAEVFDVERFWGKCGEYAIGVRACVAKVGPSDGIAHLDGAEKQFGGGGHSEQALLIFGIEQEGVQLAVVGKIGGMVVVAYDCHIQEQLHIVFLGVTRNLEAIVRKPAFARLLLNQHPQVVLDIVHTSLQSEHLAVERGFHNAFVDVETCYALRQCLAHGFSDVLFLNFGVGVEFFAQFGGEQADGIVLEEMLGTIRV